MTETINDADWTDDGSFIDDGGSVLGQICQACTFDQSVISFDDCPDARGVTDDRLHWLLEFPAEIWRGWEYCTGCGAVAPVGGTGPVDLERTKAYRDALAYVDSGAFRGRERPTLVVTAPLSLADAEYTARKVAG